MKILVLDTETTGLDPSQGAGVVEIAGVLVDATYGGNVDGPVVTGWFQGLVDPGFKIPAEASAVHHLVDDDVRGMPDLETVCANMRSDLGGWDYVFAHNAKFDRKFCHPYHEDRWGCTLKGARRLVESPSYGNQVLRYHLGLKPAFPDECGHTAHRALYDTFCTAWLLDHLLRLTSVEDLYDISGKPSLLKTVGFGKHRGRLWSELPRDYLRWVLNQSGATAFDEDVRHTANFYYGGSR